ncbi:PDZ domain-containing protein [Murinocardiopsis flavida]|uniref:PDZ domain-containing protein n=1 Tax=Murinocardiopsis flavida TaxID=645275 RepID=A0A2P8DJL6_9ACTN|nr:PDZ domain-containing protein [Murinocardiopsis flavida]PSK97394.1 PDZ domain-containing protein [Murinocardiopsis flavida]
MFRRVMTLLVSSALLVGLAVGGLLLPVPYLVASPGLSLNTLGEDDEGERIIQVDGRKSYEHKGGLSMVTVQYVGGPGARVDLFTALSAWLSPRDAVLPEEAIFPPGQSMDDISEEQSLQMDDSQSKAIAAALTQLDIDYGVQPVVADVDPELPAHGKLKAGDVITEVDGAQVDGVKQTVGKVSDREPGDPVEMTVERKGAPKDVRIDTAESDDGTAVVGVMLRDDMDFPFEVDVSVGNVGGPSAGMMFALGIMDHLSSEGLTGGHAIAGTGTIEPDGKVGGVSGVEQKMVSAQREGAEYFFVASESCDLTFDSAATGEIEVVKIDKLDDAVDALADIRGGDTDDLPRCTQK